MQAIRIHRHTAGPQGAFVNAYLVETGEGIVAVDGTLTVSDGRALRAQLEALAKPLLAVIVTHAHPDHYGGIVEVVADDDTPVIATDGVNAVIRRCGPCSGTNGQRRERSRTASSRTARRSSSAARPSP
jgi:glyoxylase-like metal-dependent hydrolase (beta-lactamase superfamily II)